MSKATHVIVDIHRNDAFHSDKKQLIGKKIEKISGRGIRFYPGYTACAVAVLLTAEELRLLKWDGNTISFHAVKLKKL